MYKCDNCGWNTKPNQKLNRVISETREKVYTVPLRDKEKRIKYDRQGNMIIKEIIGSEIVKEMNLCNRCFKKWSEE